MKKSVEKKQTYHHGDLRKTLLDTAAAILRRDGLAGLSLRAVAREAAVSHSAPAHHFPDLATLLSELAATGFHQFADALEDVPRKNKGAMQARAYVKFAKQNPALFRLMMEPERLDGQNASLRAARKRSMEILAQTHDVSLDAPTLPELGAITANLALVHGFAMLLLTGRLNALLSFAPKGTTDMDLLDAVIDSVSRPQRRKPAR